MKKSILAALLFCSFIFLNLAQAAHIVGGTLSYECLGADNYRFTMVMFRDCYAGGATFDSDPFAPFAGTVTIFKGENGVILTTKLLAAPLIEAIPSPPACFSSSDWCIEKGIYVFEANLPNSVETYHISYQRCCRNNDISNLQLPGETGMTFTISLLPGAQSACNNSPVFTDDLMICSAVGIDYEHEHFATDPDGDSLVYEFCSPLHGGGTDQGNPTAPNGVAPDPDLPPPYAPVNFLQPTFSAEQPILGNPAFAISPETGQVTGNPVLLGRYQYGVCVSEFRNGVLLSTVRWEFEHEVVAEFVAANETSEGGNSLVVFPNPAQGKVDLLLPASDEAFEVSLFDVLGNRLRSWQSVRGGSVLEISLEGLAQGSYFVRAGNVVGAKSARLMVF